MRSPYLCVSVCGNFLCLSVLPECCCSFNRIQCVCWGGFISERGGGGGTCIPTLTQPPFFSTEIDFFPFIKSRPLKAPPPPLSPLSCLSFLFYHQSWLRYIYVYIFIYLVVLSAVHGFECPGLLYSSVPISWQSVFFVIGEQGKKH